jgi:serine protease Do
LPRREIVRSRAVREAGGNSRARRNAVKAVLVLLLAWCAAAPVQPARKLDALHDFSASVEELSKRINHSVVQVFASGYALSEERDNPNTVTRQGASGSGAIVSADGYIITNGHVVSNARKVRVRLHAGGGAHGGSILQPGGPIAEAKIVGVDKETDLALLKARDGVRHPDGNGQLDELGRRLSSNARQIKPDDEMIYVQTDASIKPGNSRGPLVDSDGKAKGWASPFRATS